MLNKNAQMRKIFSNTFYIFCKVQKDKGNRKYNERIIETLLQNMPSSQKQDCEQFFSFLCKIFEDTFSDIDETELNNYSIDFNELIEKLINIFKQHKSQEVTTSSAPDKVLIGILKLIERILIVRP